MAGGVAVASGEIRHGDRVFSGNSGPAQREQPINKELIAHFKSKGDSVSWGIAASIENYEEDTKRPVLSGACIASLYDQETERELAEEVENRIERVLSDDAALLKIRRYLKTFHATARDMRAYYDVNDFFTYYDVNDFLAREHAVEVEFASGASTIAPEVLGTRATRDSNGRADVPKEHRALVPLWWLDGEMANDVWVCSTPAAFKDDVFDRLKAQDGARITDLRTVCESYFGFARATLDALERDADGDEDAMEPVKKLKKKVNDAFERRWREVLVDACGKMGDDDATERVLTREERRIWDAGRRLLPSRRHKKRLKTGVAKMARFERAN